ncbi:alkaline phosphatase D family protein [Synoicihabitans lomoniglobus]|uniref:Alkaline phosphatase D family protein n=1 Tax=Synoicihabitans lomoniglobus TaxID=2909285 RepID=A0AAE9ZUK7_9BACT|nr:alkaline phosphatase family protein [Opitutaceae bacterium LMO-M01]WED63070.1 alkaline phosphatase D family protein [Opitutaceae bacterium LMO-M01]
MRLRSLLSALLATLILAGALAAGEIVSGPMLGYRAHREVFLWLETKDAKEVTLTYWLLGQPDSTSSITHHDTPAHPAGGQIHHFRPGLLKMGGTYQYRITIDGEDQALAAPATFATQELWEWRTPPPDFSFIVGSCAYINEAEFDRPGSPYGKTTRTFELMGESDADFMIWTGDNWYWREADYDSISGLWHRPMHDRAIPEMQKLLGTMHHYATWDDHDYGPNDSNWSYEYKDTARDIFQAYWGNHAYGERDNPGVYSKFYWGDAAFFLMDNHYYRDAAGLDQDKHPEKTQWGRHQLEWLKQSLLAAKELNHFKFLFIATGNQMLQSTSRGESHELYRHEREELMEFIVENELTGVVFLTGDVHFSAMYKRELSAGQWVYEITSSPFSSGAWTNIADTPGGKDPALLPDTLVPDQNFTRVDVTGSGAERALVVTCIDKQGTVRYTRTIKLSDLRPSAQ